MTYRFVTFFVVLCMVLAFLSCANTGAKASHDHSGREAVTIGTTTPVPLDAATRYGWGAVKAGDEFNYSGKPDRAKWSVYNGPGHHNKGLRSPDAMKVAGGVLTISGDSRGKTGGMSAKFANQKYGKWETRMRVSARDPQYHPVLILWPAAGRDKSRCWEVDYAESTSDVTKVGFYLHYGCPKVQKVVKKTLDMKQWHNYAVEWSPGKVIGYIDGVKWFEDSHSPNIAMKQTVQLDWFPNGGSTRPSWMQVDWVRVYQ